MQKQIILIIAIILIVVGLSGCIISDDISNPLHGRDNRFEGTWKLEDQSSGTITFFSDGTGTMGGFLITWDIKDDLLVMNYFEGMTATSDYSFSNNDNTLTLIDVGNGNTQIFIRQ